jgi:hypothetical protein
MKVLLLIVLSAVGLWYNWRAARHWWAGQRTHMPKGSDIGGWLSVAFSVVWYLFVFAFFIGLTVNNTIFR